MTTPTHDPDCPDCGRPLATQADYDDTSEGEGESLCWREFNCGLCTGEPVDWRARYLAEAEARVAAEGEADCLRYEAEDLREWQKQAVAEMVRHCCCDDGCDAFPADCAGPDGEENPISRRCEIAALVWAAEEKG